MKILITTLGTRGDVQPFVALGRGLIAAGHEVTIATCAFFESFVTEHGMGFAPINNELIDFMHSCEGKIAMENTGNAWEAIMTAIRLLPKMGGMHRRQIEELWQACQATRPDLILFHPKALGSADFAEKLGIPVACGFFIPVFTPTGDEPAMGFPALKLGRWYNRLTFYALRASMKAVSKPIKKWRTDHGLAPASPGLSFKQADGAPIPIHYGYSPHVIPRPSDWPSSASISGYWLLESTEPWTPPQPLVDFLETGEPPIYVGFGSIFGQDPARLTQTILEAIERAGVRAILAKGWGGIEAEDGELPDSIFLLKEAPHDWLFPHMAAVVHHGGCGTTAAGLLAGKPSLICPFFGDQPFWGRQVERLGVGPKPIPQKRLTAEKLQAAIDIMLHDSAMQQRAAELGEKIRNEDGVGRAVAQIEQWIS